MKVLIQATDVNGHRQLARAGRFWPVAEPVAVEVLDQELDPPGIVTKVLNATTNIVETVERPDPLRIGQASFRAIKADRRLRVLSDGDTGAAVADAQVQAARKHAERVSGELADAHVEIAKLTEEIARLKGENEILNALLAEAQKEAIEKAKPVKGGKASTEAKAHG